jgi:hypothetical protein
MPIEWSVPAEARRVEAVASGNVTAGDLTGFVEGMRQAGVLGLAKLVDMSYAALDIHAAEVRALARSINALASGGEALGPVAFVIDAPIALETFMLFDERTAGSGRPLSIFASRRQAIDWLDSLSSGT